MSRASSRTSGDDTPRAATTAKRMPWTSTFGRSYGEGLIRSLRFLFQGSAPSLIHVTGASLPHLTSAFTLLFRRPILFRCVLDDIGRPDRLSVRVGAARQLQSAKNKTKLAACNTLAATLGAAARGQTAALSLHLARAITASDSFLNG